MAGDRFVVYVSSATTSAVWVGIAIVKEYEIITLKYIGKYNSLGDPTSQLEVKYFYKLIRSKGCSACMRLGGEHKTKLNYSTYHTKFDAKVTKMQRN